MISWIGGLLLLSGTAWAGAPRCPPTDLAQPPLFCPPRNPALPNDGQPADDLVRCLAPLEVSFYDREGKLTRGTLVIHRDLAGPLGEIFDRIRRFNAARIAAGKTFFPITSILPANRFGWSDEASMAADNTSAYNYRLKAGSHDASNLSMHAFGRAVDVNPFCNPWVGRRGDGTMRIDPPGAVDPATREPAEPIPDCALTRATELGRFVIEAFAAKGWQWGGDWRNPKDYQHFQNPPAEHEGDVKHAPFCHD